MIFHGVTVSQAPTQFYQFCFNFSTSECHLLCQLYRRRRGDKIYSEETNDAETFVKSTEKVWGVAWDPKGQQLYFSSYSDSSIGEIYRANADGAEIVTVFNSSSCKD